MKLQRMGIAALLLTLCAGGARADTTMDPALAKIEAMVQNLGYTVSEGSDKTYFEITLQGKFTYTVDFQVSGDDGTLSVYVGPTRLTKAQMAQVPLLKMLEYNDIGDTFFSLHDYSDHETIYLNMILGVNGLTPVLLRQRLQIFSDHLDDTQALWDPTQWK
jgi:hypothetical protein